MQVGNNDGGRRCRSRVEAGRNPPETKIES